MAFLRTKSLEVWGDAPSQDAIDAFKAELLALCEKHGLWFADDWHPVHVTRAKVTAPIDCIKGDERIVEILPVGSLCK